MSLNSVIKNLLKKEKVYSKTIEKSKNKQSKYEINKANLKLSRKIAVIPIDKPIDKDSWLNYIQSHFETSILMSLF